MPSGNREAYEHVRDIFENISAKAYGEACCKYISTAGSGHYVKMELLAVVGSVVGAQGTLLRWFIMASSMVICSL